MQKDEVQKSMPSFVVMGQQVVSLNVKIVEFIP